MKLKIKHGKCLTCVHSECLEHGQFPCTECRWDVNAEHGMTYYRDDYEIEERKITIEDYEKLEAQVDMLMGRVNQLEEELWRLRNS